MLCEASRRKSSLHRYGQNWVHHISSRRVVVRFLLVEIDERIRLSELDRIGYIRYLSRSVLGPLFVVIAGSSGRSPVGACRWWPATAAKGERER